LKTQIAENISDPVIKFNKTPINTGSSGHLDIRKNPHQINVFFQSIKKKERKKKQINNLLLILIFSETKDDNT
jgi:hypothetical protein